MKKSCYKPLIPFFMLFLLFSLNSCIGLSMDIQMRKDGSGKITVECRYSRTLDSLGKLDGNEDMPAIPVSREDLEKTIRRIDGLRLSSFSTSEDSKDVIFNYTLEYDNIEAFLSYVDPSGTKVTLNRENQSGVFKFILNEPSESEYDQKVLDMVRAIFDGYNFALSFSAEGNSTLVLTDGEGNEIPTPQTVKVVPSGRKVSLSMNIMELVAFSEGIGASIIW